MVYAKQPLGGPEAVLDYLGRYTHRVAISNESILGIDGNKVLLQVRADGKGGRKRTLRLAGTDFIERFLQHVLPCGFKRIRHYGLLAPAHKRTHLAAARAALGAPSPQPALIESVAAFLRRVSHIVTARCPHCAAGSFVSSQRSNPKLTCPIRGTAVTIDVPQLSRNDRDNAREFQVGVVKRPSRAGSAYEGRSREVLHVTRLLAHEHQVADAAHRLSSVAPRLTTPTRIQPPALGRVAQRS